MTLAAYITYEFTDFFKIGIPLTIVVGIVSVLLTPLSFKC
jgi:di/tricarboxylate transporter